MLFRLEDNFSWCNFIIHIYVPAQYRIRICPFNKICFICTYICHNPSPSKIQVQKSDPKNFDLECLFSAAPSAQ